MVKKDKIIKYYLKNQTKTLLEIADYFDIGKSQVSQAVSSHFDSLNIGKDIGFCFSFSFPNSLGFLFDDYREREVLLENNEILNKSDFTDFELIWLLKNYGLGNYNENSKFNYVLEAIKELELSLETANFAQKKIIKQKINCLESL